MDRPKTLLAFSSLQPSVLNWPFPSVKNVPNNIWQDPLVSSCPVRFCQRLLLPTPFSSTVFPAHSAVSYDWLCETEFLVRRDEEPSEALTHTEPSPTLHVCVCMCVSWNAMNKTTTAACTRTSPILSPQNVWKASYFWSGGWARLLR